jgi:hypothetical protein
LGPDKSDIDIRPQRIPGGEAQTPGIHYNLGWRDAKGRSDPAGVYFCTLVAEGQRFSRKVVLTE